MESKIAKAISLNYQPVALIWSDQEPAEAVQFQHQEAKAEKQRAVVGLTDLSARVSIRKLLEDHLMTFAVPQAMYEEMERNVADSFLERPTWQGLLKNK